MSTPSKTETNPLEAAANALKTGNVIEARRILRGVTDKDPNNLTAWEMTYQASDNDEDRIFSLNCILMLDPEHPMALQKLAELRAKSQSDIPSKVKAKPSPPAASKSKGGKKSRSSTAILGSLVGLAVLVCAGLWVAVFYRWGVIPYTLPVDQTRTSVAANHANCQELINRALSASSDLCDRIGSDQACYGNHTITTRLVPGAAQQFTVPGDIIGINLIESISASVLDPALNEWGIAIFKVIGNLPRSLPGETVTLVVFGNTTLENSGNLETFYFYSGLGQVACDQIPFDGLMVTMPEGTGIHFIVNGSELTLMGNASLKADRNGNMKVNLYSGSASLASDGQQQIFTAGESVSVHLGGPNGTDSIGPPSTPQPLTPDDLAVVCSMTGTYCDPAKITPVPSDIAAQWMPTAYPLSRTRTPTPTPPSSPTKTSTRTLARTPPSPTRTSTRTLAGTPPPPSAATRTAAFIPSKTSPPISGVVIVNIIIPAADGNVISNNADTAFEAQAWDTAVGTTNGDGIDHVNFWFTFAGGAIPPLPDAGSPDVLNSVRYCAFGGKSNCGTMNGNYNSETFNNLSSGIYTMYVRAWGVSGVSDVYTRTFEIP
ncbi:MAG TPA: hypothetical protein VF313_10695 [Anaerolineaceae bacterium]